MPNGQRSQELTAAAEQFIGRAEAINRDDGLRVQFELTDSLFEIARLKLLVHGEKSEDTIKADAIKVEGLESIRKALQEVYDIEKDGKELSPSKKDTIAKKMQNGLAKIDLVTMIRDISGQGKQEGIVDQALVGLNHALEKLGLNKIELPKAQKKISAATTQEAELGTLRPPSITAPFASVVNALA